MSKSCGCLNERGKSPKKLACPLNGRFYRRVDTRTVLHQVRAPWNMKSGANSFYYCDDPACEAVYFSDDGCLVRHSQLRVNMESEQNLICHCFGVTREDFETDQNVREFVIEQTREGLCACKIRNPSGRCCLAAFSVSPKNSTNRLA